MSEEKSLNKALIVGLGQDVTVDQQEIDVRNIVQQSLLENSVFHSNPRVNLKVDFQHQSTLVASQIGMTRVTSNILSNAFEATSSHDCRIWIRSEDITVKINR